MIGFQIRPTYTVSKALATFKQIDPVCLCSSTILLILSTTQVSCSIVLSLDRTQSARRAASGVHLLHILP